MYVALLLWNTCMKSGFLFCLDVIFHYSSPQSQKIIDIEIQMQSNQPAFTALRFIR